MMLESSSRESPIFTRTSEYILWLFNHTEKYPKSERFRMARHLEDAAFKFYDLLIRAVREKKYAQVHLTAADYELERLRLYTRLARKRKLCSVRQYEHALKSLDEMGKLLGGWMKTTAS